MLEHQIKEVLFRHNVAITAALKNDLLALLSNKNPYLGTVLKPRFKARSI
jgi:hypothetical protein